MRNVTDEVISMNMLSYNKFLNEVIKNARATDTPVFGSFELTPLCNLDCKMCYVHLSNPTVKERMLSGEHWINLMAQAIDHGMMVALLTGGEAMTHPDFKKIYMYLIEQGVAVRVKTNGILLNKEAIKLFTEYPPYRIDVSLYGCDSESYKAITGHDVFEIVTTNIRVAIAERQHVRLMITPSAQMLPWVDRVMEYAKSFGADYIQLNPMLFEANSDTGRHMENFGLSLEANARIHRKYWDIYPHALQNQSEEEAEFMGSIPENEALILPYGLYCNGGRAAFAINWDGTMSPCLDFPRDVICTDVKSIGFEAAWREVNRGVKDYAVPEKCYTCSYNSKCYYCPLQHKALAMQHRCVSESCDWRKLQADIEEEYRVKKAFPQEEAQ